MMEITHILLREKDYFFDWKMLYLFHTLKMFFVQNVVLFTILELIFSTAMTMSMSATATTTTITTITTTTTKTGGIS